MQANDPQGKGHYVIQYAGQHTDEITKYSSSGNRIWSAIFTIYAADAFATDNGLVWEISD